MSVDPRRRAALRALLAVGRGQDPEDAVTRAVAREEDRRAGRAVDELVRGVIQWRDRYAHLVEHFSRRGANRDPVARAVLAIALHELLLHEGTPAYASIHQAGELLRAEGKARLVGYVNGVLQAVRRHVERQGAGPLPVLRPLFDDPDVATALARWWSHPHWLVARWLERFGHDDTEALLAHQNRRPPVTLHVLPGADVAATRARLAEAGLPTNLRSGFPRALELSGRAERTEIAAALARQRDVLVQDAAAQALIDWLTRDGTDLSAAAAPMVDLCAAPGGKTAHLRRYLPDEEWLVAMDLRPRRLRRLRQNSRRLALAGTLALAGDGLRPPLRRGAFAAVLLDGPCAGTGVLRHHPEGRWRLRPETLARNHERLTGLLRAAVDLLQPGGALYYATCSLEPEENEQVLAAALAARDDLAPDPDPDGSWQRTWLPWRSGTDGFFAARLRRRDPGGST